MSTRIDLKKSVEQSKIPLALSVSKPVLSLSKGVRAGFWIAHLLDEIAGRPFMLRQAQHERSASYPNCDI